MIDYKAAYASLYIIGATNAAVLALLGGASSVMGDRRGLKNTTGKVLPWLVWTYDQGAGERGEMRDLNAAWWAYIAPNADAGVLYDIATAIDAAYINRFSVAWGRVRVGSLGSPFEETPLNNLQGLRIPLTYRRLG